MESSKNDIYYLWLSLILGAKNAHSLELLMGFESIDELYECKDYSFLNLPDKLVELLLKKDLSDAIKMAEKCKKLRVGILTYGSELFPERMKLLRTVPPVLYYIGNLIDLNKEVCITFVGTRKASEGGILNAEQIAYGCAKSGIIVVSGIASGIDRACHNGALYADKYTVGFSGLPIGRIYPRENTYLYTELYKHGVVFSEYPPETEAPRSCFPDRNRLLAAFSLGVVVIEAPKRSGALITADEASKLGRTVFAVPGDIKVSPGTNDLISEGAIVVQSYKDIVKEYEYLYQDKIQMAPYIDQYYAEVRNKVFYYCDKKRKETISISIDEKNEKQIKENDNSDQSICTAETEKESKKINRSNFDDTEWVVVSLLKKHKSLTLDDILEISNDAFESIIAAVTVLEINGIIIRDDNGAYLLS